jgi:hypothetical protein
MRGAAPSVTALTIRSSGTSTQAMPERPPLSSNVRSKRRGYVNKIRKIAALSAAIAISGCSNSPDYGCSAQSTKDIISKIVTDDIASQGSWRIFPGSSKEAISKISLSLSGIRVVSKDKDTGKHECAAELQVHTGKEIIGNDFKNDAFLMAGLKNQNISIINDGFSIPITYTTQLTEDKSQQYVESSGVSEISSTVATAFLVHAKSKPVPEEKTPQQSQQTIIGTIEAGTMASSITSEDGSSYSFENDSDIGNKIFDSCKAGDKCLITATIKDDEIISIASISKQ